ncbi:MAG: thymidine kinase [Alphaproteobacteria bacterium]|nr:thymidine kinase [Alphaproteobacteria bacterium]
MKESRSMTARLEVIVGPMFSGKTELLISRLHRAQYARKRVRIVKPAHDTRTQGFIASRAVNADGTTEVTDTLSAVMVRSERDFRRVIGDCDFDVLAVDEAQFFPLDEPPRDALGWFGRSLRDLLRERRDSSLRIIVAGLDMDFAEEPFGPIPGLLALADSVDKLTGVCMVCGSDAGYISQRIVPGEKQLVVGDVGQYQVRCRGCYEPPDAARRAPADPRAARG